MGLGAAAAGGLTAMGMGATTAAIAGPVLAGAAVGAAGSAITGGDPLMGAVMGGVGGGVSGALGGAGGDIASGVDSGVQTATEGVGYNVGSVGDAATGSAMDGFTTGGGAASDFGSAGSVGGGSFGGAGDAASAGSGFGAAGDVGSAGSGFGGTGSGLGTAADNLGNYEVGGMGTGSNWSNYGSAPSVSSANSPFSSLSNLPSPSGTGESGQGRENPVAAQKVLESSGSKNTGVLGRVADSLGMSSKDLGSLGAGALNSLISMFNKPQVPQTQLPSAATTNAAALGPYYSAPLVVSGAGAPGRTQQAPPAPGQFNAYPGPTAPSQYASGTNSLAAYGWPSAGHAHGGAIYGPEPLARGGGEAVGRVKGSGSGISDDVPAMLSNDEYVLTARDVSTIGGGSSEEGAKRLDKFRRDLHTTANRGQFLNKKTEGALERFSKQVRRA